MIPGAGFGIISRFMFGFLGRKMRKKAGPVICARPDHCISRKNIDQDALRVLYRLSDMGYTAYLVGGGVRDLLLGRKPKDFDVGTSARPNEVKHAFRNCFLIGRRFRLAHVRFGDKVIETATFRKESQTVGEIIEHAAEGPFEDNTFGTPETDAYRRDFTVNGLFYDIKTFAVIDWVGGLQDLKKRVIRSIGDPMVRFREDPVRMMRAVKFASRLDFKIERAGGYDYERIIENLSDEENEKIWQITYNNLQVDPITGYDTPSVAHWFFEEVYGAADDEPVEEGITQLIDRLIQEEIHKNRRP